MVTHLRKESNPWPSNHSSASDQSGSSDPCWGRRAPSRSGIWSSMWNNEGNNNELKSPPSRKARGQTTYGEFTPSSTFLRQPEDPSSQFHFAFLFAVQALFKIHSLFGVFFFNFLIAFNTFESLRLSILSIYMHVALGLRNMEIYCSTPPLYLCLSTRLVKGADEKDGSDRSSAFTGRETRTMSWDITILYMTMQFSAGRSL